MRQIFEYGMWCKMEKKEKKLKKEYTYSEFNKILEALHEDVLITDGSGTILQVSETFNETYGVEENVIGKTVFEMEEKGIFTPSVSAEVIRTKEAVTMKQTNLSNKHIVVTAVPIKGESGEITQIISFSRDITDYYNLQSEYANLENKLELYEKEIKELRNKNLEATGIIAESDSMREILLKCFKIASVDAPILLTGPTGTGKSLLAKFIHEKRDRKDKPFIEINCGAIPEMLLEAELFGYEEGAFTGANKKGKIGLIELSEGGTLFLDEIGELPLPLQVKLLNVIQEKKFRSVGSTKEKKVNFRLITATNRDIANMIENKKFREDLYYRINVISIDIPPLSDRKEDVYGLITCFLDKYNEKYDSHVRISDDALRILLKYNWPGNVRQLENVIERAILLSDGKEIMKKDIEEVSKAVINGSLEEEENSSVFAATEASESPFNIQEKEKLSKELKDEDVEVKIVEDFIRGLETEEVTLESAIEKIEKQLILEAYKKAGTTPKLAKMLGISQPTAHRKLKKYTK